MRKSLRLALAVSGASLVGATFLIACGDDTEVTTGTDAGAEAGTDARFDSPQNDTGLVDAGTDSDSDADIDAGFVLDKFDTTLATTICESLARCCYGTPTPGDGGADGGTFDKAACVTKFEQLGFQNSNVGPELKDGGNVVLNQTSALDCINKVKALTCDVPGAEYVAARVACFAAYRGKLAAAAPCKGAAECQMGHFCKGANDGGAGVCTALRPLGGPCGDNPDHPSEYEEACSYRAGGETNTYCKFYDFGSGDLDAGDWKCTASGAPATNCATSNWCKDSICDPGTAVCKTPDKIFDDSCGTFLKP